MSSTVTMPAKKKKNEISGEDDVRVSQTRQPFKQFRVLVDHQTKTSFDSEEEATKMAISIKKAHPVVTVSVHDATKSASTEIGSDVGLSVQ